MAASSRAQELADKLLEMETTRPPLPVEKMHFQGGMDNVKNFYKAHKVGVWVGGVAIVVAAGLIGWGIYKKKHEK